MRAKKVNEALDNLFKSKSNIEILNDLKKEGLVEQFILTDGSKIYVLEDTFPGMAGERVSTLIYLDEEGERVNAKDFFNKLSPEDKIEFQQWYERLDDDNYEAAVNSVY